MIRYDPAAWEETASGKGGADSWIFSRAIERTAEEVARLAPPGGRWLDLGCGTGTLARLLSAPARSVIALDLDPAMVRFAAARSGEGAFAAPPAYCIGRVEALPFADASFDGVTATSLLGCLTNHEPLVAEIARVLRPGGIALVTVTNRASWLLRLNHALPRSWVTSAGNRSGPRDYRLPPVDRVIESLRSAGLSSEVPIPFNVVLHLGPWIIPPPSAARLLERAAIGPFSRILARNELLIARKPARPA